MTFLRLFRPPHAVVPAPGLRINEICFFGTVSAKFRLLRDQRRLQDGYPLILLVGGVHRSPCGYCISLGELKELKIQPRYMVCQVIWGRDWETEGRVEREEVRAVDFACPKSSLLAMQWFAGVSAGNMDIV